MSTKFMIRPIPYVKCNSRCPDNYKLLLVLAQIYFTSAILFVAPRIYEKDMIGNNKGSAAKGNL